MLQLNYIRDNRDEVVRKLKKKRFGAAEETIDRIIAMDNERRAAQKKADDIKAEANVIAKRIGELMRAGKKDEAEEAKSRSNALKATEKELDESQRNIETGLTALLLTVPNTPHDDVPEGGGPADNLQVHIEEKTLTLEDTALPHWELAARYNIIDFELGVKLTGAGFPVYRGKGAKLQRALINYFLQRASEAGYEEVQPPIVVNEASAYGTGQLPDKEGQMYHATEDNLYLIPTAEVPITNIYRDVILSQDQLPLRNCGYTPCFRREAGSYGKDVRGLNRLHQFDKVEIVQIAHPDKSYQTLKEMVDHVSGLLRELELPFRVLRLCGGDMSFGSAITYDLEVFSGAQKRWLEVSSVSNFETFQTNRLKCRYRDDKGKSQLAHSLNGSALALPRIVAALLENNQRPDGIHIPEVLRPYCGFSIIN